MKKITLFFMTNRLLIMLLLFSISPFVQNNLHSQIVFQDGFETGTIVNWTNMGGSYSFQGVTTTDPAVGTFSLEQTGTSSHYGGLRATLPSSQPTEITWRVKTTDRIFFIVHFGYGTSFAWVLLVEKEKQS